MHRDGDTEMVMMYQGTSNVRPVTILINGYGVFKEFYKNGTTYYTPYAFFNVTKVWRGREIFLIQWNKFSF